MFRFTRILAWVLCLGMILGCWGCNGDPAPDGTTSSDGPGASAAEGFMPTETVIATVPPDESNALSDLSILESWQVGEYAESAFLANVPYQGTCLELSVREDGTVDYIFCQETESSIFGDFYLSGTLQENRVQYYTVSPTGEATLQPMDWVKQLDDTIASVTSQLEDEKNNIRLDFSVQNGTVMILLTINFYNLNRYFGVYCLRDGLLTQVPLEKSVSWNGQAYSLRMAEATAKIFAQEDGFLLEDASNLFRFSTDGTCLAVRSRTQDKIYTTRGCENGKVWMSNLDSRQLLVLDSTTLELLDTYDSEELYLYNCAVGSTGDGLYNFSVDSYGQHNQIFRVDKEGVTPVLDDSSLYSLYELDVTHSTIAAAPDGTLYIHGTEGNQGVLRQYRYNPEGARDQDTFTIYSLEENPTIRSAVAMWNSSSPAAKAEYIVAAEEIQNSALTLDDAIKQLNTQLFNGEGPDVIVLDGLPGDSLIRKGFLAPLDTLDTGGVFPNIIERFSLGDQLYAVPGTWQPFLAGGKTGTMDNVSSLKTFADYVEEASAPLNAGYMGNLNAAFKKMVWYVQFPEEVFDLWYPAWCDGIWEDGIFQDQVYKEFLLQTGRLVEHYGLKTMEELLKTWPEDEKTGLSPKNYTILNATDNPNLTLPYCLATTSYAGFSNFIHMEQVGEEIVLTAIPHEVMGIPAADGTGAATVSAVAALRLGGNTEMGTAFIQMMLSDPFQLQGREDQYDRQGYPVKWTCLDAFFEIRANFQGVEPAMESDLRTVLEGLNIELQDRVTWTSARNAALKYYEGILTLDQAVEQVTQETLIYLAEQR